MYSIKYNIFLLFFISTTLFSNVLEKELSLSYFNQYENILQSVYNKNSNFVDINKQLRKLKINNANLLCTKNKSNSIVITLNNDYTFSKLHLNKKDDYDRLLMILAINTFLFNESIIDFEYYDYDKFDSNLFRKNKMLNHIRSNYESLLIDEYNVLYEDSVTTLWLKKTEEEFIILGLNNINKNKQISIDLSELKPQYALSMLDRSMVRFEDGKANIDFSDYQTRIFNLKR